MIKCYYLVTKTWKIHPFCRLLTPIHVVEVTTLCHRPHNHSAHLCWWPSTFRGHGAEYRIIQARLDKTTTYIEEEVYYSERQKKPPFYEGAFFYTLQSSTMGGGTGRRASGSLCQLQPSLLPPHTFTHPHVTWCLHTWSPTLMWCDASTHGNPPSCDVTPY